MKRKLLMMLVFSQFMFSQSRNCGVVEKMENLKNSPERYQKYLLQQEKFNVELKRLEENQKKGISEKIAALRIPVAVHYPSAKNLSQAEKNCLISLAQSQIDVLNADYTATNTDISTWINDKASYFPGVNYGAMDVQFELASGNHPLSTGLASGDLAVTFGQKFGGGPDGDWDPDWAGYYNIVVEALNGGTLGYAYLASDPADGAAVFINASEFGKGSGCTGYAPSAPYDLGRTLTHEAGHYLNLNHIWGEGTCGDDGVADTPQHNTSNGGCPSISHLSTCTGTPRELTMNYMDYTNDACMYMFTQGQVNRMQAHMNTIQSNFNQTTLSVKNYELSNGISVYPNPSKGSFKIQFSNALNKYEIEIIDQSGRVVYSKEVSNNNDLVNDFDLNSPSEGVYLIKIKTNDAVAVKRLIVK
ncbi:zinc-dependent metalloprotease [Flavobacterium sp. H122]|uniref:zinc-dependent metalloprotease n=1 Tax=Flavobacterium sp. H122 TaxID=2529860 RepID=UPI00145AA9EA|nr:zinc-dependent metalloprotease [Flavobacterium sp. H122]